MEPGSRRARVADFPGVLGQFLGVVGDHPACVFLFRGRADQSPIVPKIGRLSYNYAPARERALHNAFVRAARPVLPMPLSSDLEWLALAQHHGAPTRLVDWSTSPLVAAWFAVTSDPVATDAAIFALESAVRRIGGLQNSDH